MKKYNLSKIMKRAWELVKKNGMTISTGLKKAWEEAKKTTVNLVDALKANIQEMAYQDRYISLGMERVASSKVWEKGEAKRAYLSIQCFTLSGRYKGAYKCGYVDLVTNEYVCGRYDDVNAVDMLYIGR